MNGTLVQLVWTRVPFVRVGRIPLADASGAPACAAESDRAMMSAVVIRVEPADGVDRRDGRIVANSDGFAHCAGFDAERADAS